MEDRNIDIPTNSSVFYLFGKKNILNFWVWGWGGLRLGLFWGWDLYKYNYN